MSGYPDGAPVLLWQHETFIQAAAWEHLDGCTMCGRVVSKGQPYHRVVAMTDEDSRPQTTRLHCGCVPCRGWHLRAEAKLKEKSND